MKRDFRLLSIALDDDEEVAAVTAAVSARALSLIGRFVNPPPTPLPAHPADAITLTAAELLTLFAASGKFTGFDAGHEQAHEIYDSLSHVVYGMMETE